MKPVSDLVTFGETMLRLSPAGNERIETASEFEVRAAGAESNVAIAAERLGTSSTWISKLPENPLGRRVAGELERYGIDADPVWTEDGRQGTYYLEQAGKPRGTNVVYDRANAAVTTAEADEFDLDALRDAEVFFTSGITPALSETLEETTATLLETASRAGTTTAFDLNYRNKLWSPSEAKETLTALFENIDVLVVAARDARHVLDLEGDAEALAETLGTEYGFETVVLTRGSDGALAWRDGEYHEHDAYETETVDPIGTGDAFTGAFLARRIDGDDVSSALEYAAATAALKRTIPGDIAVVTPAEVESVIGEQTSDISR